MLKVFEYEKSKYFRHLKENNTAYIISKFFSFFTYLELIMFG